MFTPFFRRRSFTAHHCNQDLARMGQILPIVHYVIKFTMKEASVTHDRYLNPKANERSLRLEKILQPNSD